MTEEHQLGDAPIQSDLRDVMNLLGKTLDEVFNGPNFEKGKRKNGYILMVFPFTETGDGEGRCNYISNAQREDVVAMLRHQLARFGGQPDITGNA